MSEAVREAPVTEIPSGPNPGSAFSNTRSSGSSELRTRDVWRLLKSVVESNIQGDGLNDMWSKGPF